MSQLVYVVILQKNIHPLWLFKHPRPCVFLLCIVTLSFGGSQESTDFPSILRFQSSPVTQAIFSMHV